MSVTYSMIETFKARLSNCPSPYKNYWLNQLANPRLSPLRLEKLVQLINQELQAIDQRQRLMQDLTINYPQQLPVSAAVAEIKAMISHNQLTIICGETGSGKTTQLPKILMELGYGRAGLIGHTQPRRLAAKALAARINYELGAATGSQAVVACKMRFHDRTSAATIVKLMTDGILLQEIQNDKLLLRYSALIIDEVHERSLNIDFILGYLKQLLVKRPTLKIIITSATLDASKLSKFFNHAPVINVSGKTYPVDIIYQPLEAKASEDNYLYEGIYQAIGAALSVDSGHGLVFLPGEREIKQCLTFLRKTQLRNYQLLPLFARLSNEEQARIFAEDGRVKIILATNIAETSLTIPGIKFVIDSGLTKVKRYSIRQRVEQLQIEPTSQASSNQRAGRAGRVSHGLCVRLFAQTEFDLRRQFTEPELLRSNLANVILRLLALNLGDPFLFPFLDRPEVKTFNDGYRTLFQLQAIDANNVITELGRKLAQIPTDVQLARILVAAASTYNCLNEALVIVSFLSIQDPRESPLEQRQLARERQQLWQDKHSAFTQILNLWHWYHEQLLHKKSNHKLAEICHKQFVSLIRLREWHELQRQLKEIMLNLGYKLNQNTSSYRELHSAILSGFMVNIGQKDVVDNYYLGPNTKKFFIHPAEIIAPAKWVLAATLVASNRLYARNCAEFEPQWLQPIAGHLYKYTYSNARWDQKRGEVVAIQSSLLYGLLIEQKKVSFAKLNPIAAREIFIKEALVTNQLQRNYRFIAHNLRLVEEVAQLEDKFRTYLVDIDDELYQFYAQMLPLEVIDQVTLETFVAANGEARLHLERDQFMAKINASGHHHELFPAQIFSNHQAIALSYVFDPDSHEDGIIAKVKLEQISEVNPHRFEWLVPGLIRDKLNFMFKALPKNQRLQFHPLADSITELLTLADINDSLVNQLINYAQLKKIKLDYSAVAKIQFPKHLCCHFRIMDGKKIIASGDDLAVLRIQLKPLLSKLIIQQTTHEQLDNVRGFIPEFVKLLQPAKLSNLGGYYSLVLAADNSVSFTVVSELSQAQSSTRRSLQQLIKLQLNEQIKYLQRTKPADFNQLSLALQAYYSPAKLAITLVNYSVNQAIAMTIGDKLPSTQSEYQAFIQASRAQVHEVAGVVNSSLSKIAALYLQLKVTLTTHPLLEEISLQLEDLLYPDFLNYTKWHYLINFPRYLQAILVRLDKYFKARDRDKAQAAVINLLYDKWYNYVDDLEKQHKIVTTELYEFKYKIEELRISLFAESIKTLYPVSFKRLDNELEQLYNKSLH